MLPNARLLRLTPPSMPPTSGDDGILHSLEKYVWCGLARLEGNRIFIFMSLGPGRRTTAANSRSEILRFSLITLQWWVGGRGRELGRSGGKQQKKSILTRISKHRADQQKYNVALPADNGNRRRPNVRRKGRENRTNYTKDTQKLRGDRAHQMSLDKLIEISLRLFSLLSNTCAAAATTAAG